MSAQLLPSRLYCAVYLVSLGSLQKLTLWTAWVVAKSQKAQNRSLTIYFSLSRENLHISKDVYFADHRIRPSAASAKLRTE